MSQRELIEPGIYFGLDEKRYFAADGLSNSGMKHLAVSPLWYWHNNLNPAREQQEETYPQRWGKAVHCRLLEPDRFRECYAAELSKDDYPDALVTDDDLKAWLTERCLPVTGKRKQDRIERVRESGHAAVIWDDLVGEHSALTAGKLLLSAKEMRLLEALAATALADPFAKVALSDGVAEVSFFVRDPESGVMLKARMDYVKPSATIDLKTFSNSRGKPTDKVVFDAIYYEGYYQQCAYYHKVRELARQQIAAGEIRTHGLVSEAWIKGFVENERHAFGFVFVESAQPFDLRIVQLRRSETAGGQPNIYWSAAESQIEESIRLYAECYQKFGGEPWREPRPPHVLQDIDLPQLMFS